MGKPSGTSKRKYRHIFRHRMREVWQAVRRGFPAVAVSASQEQVALAAARAWGVKKESLMLAVRKPNKNKMKNPLQRCRHVTWHSKALVWVVQHNQTYVGSSSDHGKAVSMAKKYFKIPQHKLELEKPRRHGNNAGDTSKRFMLLWHIYGQSGHMLPLDAAHLLGSAANKFVSTCKVDGAILPYLLAKFPCHRKAVATTCQQHTSGDEVRVLYDVLVQATCAIACENPPEEQMRNLGRRNQHHASWAVLMSKSLGLLQKATRKRGPQVVLLGKNKAAYHIKPLDKALQNLLSTWCKFGKELRKSATPSTCKMWNSECIRLQKVIKDERTTGLLGNYRGLWSIRCYLLQQMRLAGKIELREFHNVSVKDFTQAFPDMKKQALAMASGDGKALMVDVVDRVQYTGPIELFTMWCCLFQDSAVATVPTPWIQEHRDLISKICSQYCKEHCFPPHPGVLLEIARKDAAHTVS